MKLTLLYVVILHVFIVIVLMNSDFIYRLNVKFGRIAYDKTEFYRKMVVVQTRTDSSLEQSFVIFIGDSITQSLCVSCVFSRAVNYGIAGDTSAGVLKRLKQYDSLKVVRAVVVAVGVNDLEFVGDDKVLENYEGIIRSIPQEVKIIFSAVLPVNTTVVRVQKLTNSRIEGLNNKARLLCAKFENCFFTNARESLVGSNGSLKSDYHTGDGIHLSKAGYTKWIEVLRNALEVNGIEVDKN